MSVIVRATLLSVFLLMVYGCNSSTSTEPECVNAGDNTMVCGDVEYYTDQDSIPPTCVRVENTKYICDNTSFIMY